MDTPCAIDKIKSIHIIFKENELYETFIIDSENKKIEEPITSEILIDRSLNEQAHYIYMGPKIYCNRCGINNNEDIEKLKKIDFQEYHEIIINLKKNRYENYVIIKTKKNIILINYNNYLSETSNICFAAWPILEKLVNIEKYIYYDFLNGISTK